MERHQRELEAKADNHHAETCQQQRFVQHVVAKALTERDEGQVAGLRIQQRHTKQQEGRSGGGQNGVLDARFQ